MTRPQKHVLGLSGGKDSSALAVYMSQYRPDLDIDYFFTDTGKELPEVYTFLTKLEGVLGKPILRLNPDKGFDYWLDRYDNFLPSARARWCTRQLKIEPFEKWIKPLLDEFDVTSYVAIRADEQHRLGYDPSDSRVKVEFPFQDAGIDKSGVLDILDRSGLGLPEYYSWRSRSGCTFCFFQRHIEWVRLMEQHPDAFEEAKAYEKTSTDQVSGFTWIQNEPLSELEKPDRIAEIKAKHELQKQKAEAKRARNPLRPDSFMDNDEIYGVGDMCITCHK